MASQTYSKGFGNVDYQAVGRASAYGALTGAAVGSGAGIVGLGTRLLVQAVAGAAGSASGRAIESKVTGRPIGDNVKLAAGIGAAAPLAGTVVSMAVGGTAVAEAATQFKYVPTPAPPIGLPSAFAGAQIN